MSGSSGSSGGSSGDSGDSAAAAAATAAAAAAAGYGGVGSPSGAPAGVSTTGTGSFGAGFGGDAGFGGSTGMGTSVGYGPGVGSSGAPAGVSTSSTGFGGNAARGGGSGGVGAPGGSATGVGGASTGGGAGTAAGGAGFGGVPAFYNAGFGLGQGGRGNAAAAQSNTALMDTLRGTQMQFGFVNGNDPGMAQSQTGLAALRGTPAYASAIAQAQHPASPSYSPSTISAANAQMAALHGGNAPGYAQAVQAFQQMFAGASPAEAQAVMAALGQSSQRGGQGYGGGSPSASVGGFGGNSNATGAEGVSTAALGPAQSPGLTSLRGTPAYAQNIAQAQHASSPMGLAPATQQQAPTQAPSPQQTAQQQQIAAIMAAATGQRPQG